MTMQPRIAVVTGAASGIGRATAQVLAEAGARVVIADIELWNKLIALNLVGPMQLVKALLPAMMERGSGSIVNIASDAGRVGSLGETVYSAAKGGLIAFTKSRARSGALRHQRQLRLPGADRNAPAVCRARKSSRGAREGDSDAPFRQTRRGRRRGGVLRQQPRQLHHRAGAQREWWVDDGGVIDWPARAARHPQGKAGRVWGKDSARTECTVGRRVRPRIRSAKSLQHDPLCRGVSR